MVIAGHGILGMETIAKVHGVTEVSGMTMGVCA